MKVLVACEFSGLVRDAFLESVAQGTMKLSYVRAIAKKLGEKKTIKSWTDRSAQVKKEEKYCDFSKIPEFQKLKQALQFK